MAPYIDRPVHRICSSALAVVLATAIFVVLSSGCRPVGDEATPPQSVLRLATTTSTHDSGLLDQLLPAFEQDHGCRVDIIAEGTGAALKLGERGEVDVLIVHAPAAEKAFVEAGHGTRRETFMLNHFVIVGPESDPANIRGADAVDALIKIATARATFISRGDDSGTHKREVSLWKQAGGRPIWDAYTETGQGMGDSLRIADEKRGYVLSDQGTFSKMKSKLELVPLTASSDALENPYSVIAVDASKHEKIDKNLANALIDFLLSAAAQKIINDYQVDGQTLFHGTR